MLNFQTVKLSIDEWHQVQELIQQAGTEPFFNANDILYEHSTVIKNNNRNEFITQLGYAAEITKRFELVDGDEQFVEFTFTKNGIDKSILLPREVLLARKTSRLFSCGYSYNQAQKLDIEFANYLAISEQLAPLAYKHKSVGLMERDGKKIFALDKVVGHIQSEYYGELDLKPRGDLNVWCDLIKTSIVGRSGLEFALCTGFAAMVINFLPEINQGECIFVNIGGSLHSSVGKSTGTMVGASIFGSPSIQGGRLVNSWRATDPALPALMKDNTGVLISFDEYSLREKKENIDFLYLFTQGRPKEACKPDGTLRELHHFCTVILSNSELSILAAARSVKEGQIHRCIEYGKGFDFTDSEQHADYIKSTLINNYGHAAYEFARYLIDHQNELHEAYEEIHDMFKKILNTDDRLKLRVAKRYSMIFLAGALAKAVFGFGIHIENLMRLAADNIHATMTSIGEDDRALEYLLQYVAINSGRFPDKSDFYDCDKNDNIFGYFESKNMCRQLVIAKEKFKNIMREGGFEDPQKVAELFKSKGLLDFEKGKTYRERKLGKINKTPCIVVILNGISPAEPETNFYNKKEDKIIDIEEDNDEISPDDIHF